jgi:hypothetical protein
MKKEQIIFSEISELNTTLSHSSSLGSYVSESSRMVSEYIYKKIIKSIPENSLAFQILTNNDNYSEKQLWIITFELLKNENYCNEIMEEFYERNSREFTKKIIKKDRQTLKSQKKENQKENKKMLDIVESNGKKATEYYAFLLKNKNFCEELKLQKFSIESVNAFLAN